VNHEGRRIANLMPTGSQRVSEPVPQDRHRRAVVTLLAFDTDTTGLFPIMHRLVEGEAVQFRSDGRELGTFQTLINPEVPIPPDIKQVHGITDGMVRGQTTNEDVLPRFVDLLGAPDTILLAHNAPFDPLF
jgi:DNA polymerase III epsilon subunit-like protein